MKVPGQLGDLLCEAFKDWGRAKTGLPRGKSAEDLIRHLAGLRLHMMCTNYDGAEEFPKLAKHLGVDLSAILKPKVQTTAQKKAKAA